MNALQSYLAALGPGIDVVAGAQGMSEAELKAAGAPDVVARSLHRLAHSFFGRTRFSAKQATAVQAARRNGHSLPTLETIDAHARRIKKQTLAWELRLKLCRTKADASAIKKLAAKEVRRLRPRKEPEPGITVTRHHNGTTSLRYTDSSLRVEDLRTALGTSDPIARLHELVFGPGHAAKPLIQPLVVIPVAARPYVVEGSEVRFPTDNGASISGAELAQDRLDAEGWAVVVDGFRQPINAYRLRRHGNAKHRIMATAESPRCAWPGCRRPAAESRLHHLRAWAHGGETNADNLCLLCDYHNGINDDDPATPLRRGRMERRTEGLVWVSPSGNVVPCRAGPV